MGVCFCGVRRSNGSYVFRIVMGCAKVTLPLSRFSVPLFLSLPLFFSPFVFLRSVTPPFVQVHRGGQRSVGVFVWAPPRVQTGGGVVGLDGVGDHTLGPVYEPMRDGVEQEKRERANTKKDQDNRV